MRLRGNVRDLRLCEAAWHVCQVPRGGDSKTKPLSGVRYRRKLNGSHSVRQGLRHGLPAVAVAVAFVSIVSMAGDGVADLGVHSGDRARLIHQCRQECDGLILLSVILSLFRSHRPAIFGRRSRVGQTSDPAGCRGIAASQRAARRHKRGSLRRPNADGWGPCVLSLHSLPSGAPRLQRAPRRRRGYVGTAAPPARSRQP